MMNDYEKGEGTIDMYIARDLRDILDHGLNI